jgi:RNA polymerase sigma-70 factor (ECF subfamily)
MKADPADLLLEQLARGNVEAAADLYAAFTPYLRAIVRRQLSDALRPKFDSADVVQSVWVHVVRQLGKSGWKVQDGDQLRALLATIARRRLVSRVRHHARAVGAERGGEGELAAAPDEGYPRPSEVAQADELWDELLRLCPAEHHEVLRLRREGLLFAEIATRTGLHEGSVRRILRRLSRELALRQEPLPGAEPGPTGPDE